MRRAHDGQYRGYGYTVETKTINRLGENNFAAKVVKIVRYRDAGPADAVQHMFHEHWGVTDDAATALAVSEVEAWIDGQIHAKGEAARNDPQSN